MSRTATALAALALAAVLYCAVSVWLVALPATVPALVVAGVAALAFHALTQLVLFPALADSATDRA